MALQEDRYWRSVGFQLEHKERLTRKGSHNMSIILQCKGSRRGGMPMKQFHSFVYKNTGAVFLNFNNYNSVTINAALPLENARPVRGSRL